MRTHLLAAALVLSCGLTFNAGAQAPANANLSRQSGTAAKADWLTDGADVQRSGWQRNETTLTPDNVRNLKIVWKLQLDNAPREMHGLLPALIVGEVSTASGAKEIAVVAGSSDNIYAIDVAAGQILWK